jgi:hypothetical protein
MDHPYTGGDQRGVSWVWWPYRSPRRLIDPVGSPPGHETTSRELDRTRTNIPPRAWTWPRSCETLDPKATPRGPIMVRLSARGPAFGHPGPIGFGLICRGRSSHDGAITDRDPRITPSDVRSDPTTRLGRRAVRSASRGGTDQSIRWSTTFDSSSPISVRP